MDPSAYQVGTRVYRGASNAPTRGTVDPMGYINRGLGTQASPVGMDGLSDKRSGLAQAALQRLGGGGMSSPSSPPVVPPSPPAYEGPQTGFIVSATGKLIPKNGSSLQQTMQQAPDPAILMQAAQQRLQHHVKKTEMLSKHHLTMEKLRLQAAQALERFKQQQVTNG